MNLMFCFFVMVFCFDFMLDQFVLKLVVFFLHNVVVFFLVVFPFPVIMELDFSMRIGQPLIVFSFLLFLKVLNLLIFRLHFLEL